MSTPAFGYVQYIGTANPHSETVTAGGIQQSLNVVPGQTLQAPEAICVFLVGEEPNWWIPANGWLPPPAGPPLGPLVTITASASPYRITAANEVILCDTTGGNILVYLPFAQQFVNGQFTVKSIAGANTVSLQPAQAATPVQFIDGAIVESLTGLQAVTVVSDGSTWHVLDSTAIGGGGGGTNYQTLDVGGAPQTQRAALNLIAGANVTIANVDNAGANRSDVTIAAISVYIPGTAHDAAHTYAASIASGSQTPSAGFSGLTSADVGKTIAIAGAGTAGAHLVTTIQSVAGGVPTLTAAAGTTVVGVFAIYGTDDTTAIQAWLNGPAPDTNITLADAVYLVAGAVQFGIAQLTLPTIAAGSQPTYALAGTSPLAWVDEAGNMPWSGVIFFSTNQQVGAGSGGQAASVIGGPVAGNNINVYLNLGIRQLPNPTLNGIDLRSACNYEINGLRVDTPDSAFVTTQPTHVTFGVLLTSETIANAMNRIGKLWTSGYYAGALGGECLEADVIQAYGCLVAYAPTATYHQNRIASFWPLHCKYSIAYVDVVAGVAAFPALATNQNYLLTIDIYDVEYDGGRLSWPAGGNDINDPTNLLTCLIRTFRTVTSGSGSHPAITLNGAGQVAIGATVRARMRISASQSIPSATQTAIIWTGNDYNVGGLWAAGNPTRLTAPGPGLYLITANGSWPFGTAGTYLAMGIARNGAALGVWEASVDQAGPTDSGSSCSALIHLNAGDYVELVAYQNSGAAVNFVATGGFSVSSFSMVQIG